MPPKPAKKGSAKKPNAPGAADGNNNWEAGLTKAQFEEESWQACVSLVVGRTPEDEKLIQALALAVQQPPLRKLFNLVTWDSTLAKIHELGNTKAKKPDDVPMFNEVTEPAKMLLDAGEEIPCDLMAKILKFQLLHIKANDQQRREAEQAEELKAKAVPPPASKDKEAAKAPDKDKKGKGPPTPPDPSKDKKTKLRRRDDVDPPLFIDDEPEDGPQHYILVLGFHQPQLIGALDAIGVHVANVIKLCSEHKQTSEEKQKQLTCEVIEQSLTASPILEAEEADVCSNEEIAAQARKLDLFWSALRTVLDSGPQESKLHDVVELSFIVPDVLLSLNTQDTKPGLEIGGDMFDGVASLIYDCLTWRRQHHHYLDNIKLISVPTIVRFDPQRAEVVPTPVPATPRSKKKVAREESLPEQVIEPPPLSTDVDMRYYSNLLDLVPPEACSVPLVLHCMLEQVVISTEQSLSSATEKPKPGPGFDHQLVGFMLQSFLPLLHTEQERSRLLSGLMTTVQNEADKKKLVETFGEEERRKKLEHPQVIRHHDERALRLRDIRAVQGFDPAEVEVSIMRMSPVGQLIRSVAQRRNSDSCWMAVKQQLQHYCTDDVVPWLEVEHFFHQSVFESMPLTKLDQTGVILKAPEPLGTLEPSRQQTPTIIPWDNPLSYAKQQLHNLCTKGPTFLTEDPGNTERISVRVCSQLDVSEIQSCRLRSLFDWHYAEHHEASIFPQVLQLASEEYCCLDSFRGSHDNILYIFCHNPMSPYRQCKEFWNVELHTDVKFRKYLEHVADTITDWMKEEELKREAMLNPISDEPLKDEKATDCAEEKKTLEPVVRKDSLKAWKLVQELLKEEELSKSKSKKDSPPKGKPQKQDTSKDKKSKDKKSRAETAGGKAKTSKESTIAPPGEGNQGQHQTEEAFNAFIGYSADGKLIHLSGRLQHLFPSDGGHITVEDVRYVEGSSMMKLAVKKDGHRFCTHVNQVVVDPARPPQPQEKDTNGKNGDLKASKPVEVKRVKQGSLSAVLDNGIHISYSFYGPTGEYIVSPQDTSVPVPVSSRTDLDSDPLKTHSPFIHTTPPQSQSTVCKGQPTPFNSLNLSVPNGLLLQFLREDTQEEQGMLVKQAFPLHGGGAVGQLQDPSLSKELSRMVTSQGAVIRHMRDGSTEILFADGSVSFSQDSGPVWVPDSEVEKENKKEQGSEEEADAQRGCWLTTTPSGARIHTVGTTHRTIPTTPLLAFKATDPITHEVMLSREDLVVSVQNPNGSLSVDHADGTRITSLHQDRPPNTPQSLHTDSIDDNLHIQDTCDNGEEKAVEKECENVSADVNGKRSASDSDKGSVSTKERVVLVEKEGCATVVMYPDRHMAHVFLADGTVITGNNQGAYQVFPSSMGLLQIQSDGKCVYSSDPLLTPSPKGGTPTEQQGSYTMSHTDHVACDVTDPDGNHFQVMEDGQLSVLNFSPAPSALKHDEQEPEDEEDREMARVNGRHRENCPRLFLVHEDGSGTELLSSQTVEEVLYKAYSDHTIALLKEPLPDTQDEFGITILKPSHQSVWSQWLLGKQSPDITPPNLKNRTWHDFPRTERKCPGPPFGTDMGLGLTLRDSSGGCVAQRQHVRSCPKALEMRELYKHRPFTTPLKDTVDTRLKRYIENLMEREQRSEEMRVKDPRTEEESVRASDLLNLVLSFGEEEVTGHTFDNRTSVDIANLYSQGVGAPTEQLVSTDTAATESFTNRKESKWTERLAQYRQEMGDEQAFRDALRKKDVVPFFHPENVPLYQNLLNHQAPDMERLYMNLPPIPKSDSAEAIMAGAPQEDTPRPLHPTPSKSASHEARSDRILGKRPTNPTPQTAAESSVRGSSGQCKSLHVGVTGKPRRTKVRLPASILSSKPCSVPNQQFLSVEEPVRRKCCTISLTNPNVIMRGFQLLPSSVAFGTLQEGTSSTITVVMKNVGVDTCRFHVKQPAPSAGLRVIYNPGPVAAGLHVELQVQLFAMCAAQAGEVEPKGYISQDIIIQTEKDILYLPVTATILPEKLYDIWLKDHTSAHNKKSSKVLQLSSGISFRGGVNGPTEDQVPY